MMMMMIQRPSLPVAEMTNHRALEGQGAHLRAQMTQVMEMVRHHEGDLEDIEGSGEEGDLQEEKVPQDPGGLLDLQDGMAIWDCRMSQPLQQ